MRRRLLVATLAVIVAALLAFAVPLAIAVRGLLVDRALDALQGEVEQLATVIDEQARTCDELQLLLAVGDRSGAADLTLIAADGRVIAFGQGEPPDLGDEVSDAAAQGRSGRRASGGQLAVAAPLRSDRCGIGLLLHAARSDDAVRSSVREAWLGLGGVGLVVLAAAATAAVLLGRQLARPFEALATSARRLGDGDFTARAPRSGLPEADAIAAALDGTADRLGRALGRGTAFTADASHQLRTPLTALRLHLEAASATGAPPDAVAGALAEADRLEATVDELVTLTRVDATETEVDLTAVVTDRVASWRALAGTAGREVVVHAPAPVRAHARAAAIGQALQVLLDNAVEHGEGTITVSVAAVAGAGGRVCVTDEGPGPARVDPAASGGRGLLLARSLIEAEGGRLTLEGLARGTRACLHLPGRV